MTEKEYDAAEYIGTISLEEFQTELIRLDKEGRELTLKHKQEYGEELKDAKNNKGGKRYHAPGTGKNCPSCDKINQAFINYHDYLKKYIGMTGIPLDGMLSAIHITRATILMMKKGGEL